MRALFRLFPFVRRLWRSTRSAELVHVMANSGWAWHFFAAPAIWIAWLRGVPVIVNYRGGDADAFFARQFRFIRPTLARAGIGRPGRIDDRAAGLHRQPRRVGNWRRSADRRPMGSACG
jgi:hypothetical protein